MDDLTRDSSAVVPALTSVSGLLAGRYRVRSRLGRGAMKEVFLAYDERLDREVALAIVVGADGDLARARVTREAQVTGRLGDHPNVITVYDSGELDGVPYLVLRAMRGGSLADLLDRGRPSFADAIRLGGEIAAALAHAHKHGVVHRDVKPDNVWLASDGRAALGDFGIAYRAGQDRLTAEGGILGTVRYLAPERIRGEATAAGDLYALGVTLYELVTGRPPFSGTDPDSVLHQHLSVAPEVPSRREPGVPAALERLILELLAKRPERRPRSAHEVVLMLAGMHASAGHRARPAGVADEDGPATSERGGRPKPSTVSARRESARRVLSVLAVSADVGDPEALHRVLDEGAAVIEHHGGSVERYLGDTLVAIFGLVDSQGDDALRAARAAVALCAERAELRIGIETGEVFLGSDRSGAPIATGVPIAAAGRLAERAARGEILLGDNTRAAMGRDATIDVDSGALLNLDPERPGLLRTPGTPFVGRARELGALLSAFAQVREEGTCRLVTVVGAAGIGKSRLAGEFLAAVGDKAMVLAGRCVAYGEGTTYRALAEIVRGLGPDPRRRVEQLLDGDQQAIRGLLGAVGLSDEPAQAEETAWALRRLLQRLARDRPLVVAVEDIHWADDALLDLLDHVVALSGGSPILLVCLTRPDLLEDRPTWRATHRGRSLLELGALGDEEARALAERLGATGPAARIAARAEGNPLFVEQLVAVDAGQDTAELPASIQAVLAARIDRLEEGERTLLRHAAVEGRTFHSGPLGAALPEDERPAIGACLGTLTEKGLIGPDRPEFAGENAFRFTHALIRDAAYAGIPKERRAHLHSDLAAWLECKPEAADEIVGFHFEQACVLAAELGRAGRRERDLARRAVGRLESASQAALARRDPATASTFLERSLALLDDDDAAREHLLPGLGASLFEAGRMTDATRVLDQAIAGSLDPRSTARARIEREIVRLEADTRAGTEQSRLVADAVMPLLERDGDLRGQSRAWSLRAQLAWTSGHMRRADEAFQLAAGCATRAGDGRELFDIVGWRATAALLGPTHVDAAIRQCEEFREIVSASPVALTWVINPLAVLHAMKGDFEIADAYVREANETLAKLGGFVAGVSHQEAHVRLLAGRPDLAEIPLREGIENLSEMGEGRALATTTAMLAQAVFEQGRAEEADELCRVTEHAAAPDDIVTQAIWRGVRARLLASEGRCGEAVAQARDAVSLIEVTDLLAHHADALLDLADVLSACSRRDAAEDAIRSALELCERKGNVATAARARSLRGAS